MTPPGEELRSLGQISLDFTRVLFPFIDCVWFLLTVINHICEDDYMLSPATPLSESGTPGGGLGTSQHNHHYYIALKRSLSSHFHP